MKMEGVTEPCWCKSCLKMMDWLEKYECKVTCDCMPCQFSKTYVPGLLTDFWKRSLEDPPKVYRCWYCANGRRTKTLEQLIEKYKSHKADEEKEKAEQRAREEKKKAEEKAREERDKEIADQCKNQYLNKKNERIKFENRQKCFSELKLSHTDRQIKNTISCFGQCGSYVTPFMRCDHSYRKYIGLKHDYVDDFMFKETKYHVSENGCYLASGSLGADEHYLKYRSFRFLNAMCFLLCLKRLSIYLPKDLRKLIFYMIYKKKTKRRQRSGRSRRYRRSRYGIYE